MSALIDEARKYENEKTVLRMPHHDFLELMIQGDLCGGCVVKDRYTGEIRRLKGPVILASGGLSGLFPGCATGTVHNTGIVTAAAFRQGVELANLEFIQSILRHFRYRGNGAWSVKPPGVKEAA